MDVDGISVAAAESIEGQLLDTIAINGSGHLIFTRNNGEVIDAGNVMRPILDCWPIGSIHISVNPANPSTYFGGGTWAAWGTGRVPVGVDPAQSEFNTVEETGGAKTHTLAVTEMPGHTHTGTTGNQSQTHRHSVDIDLSGNHHHDIVKGDSNTTGSASQRLAPGNANTLNSPSQTSTDGQHTHNAIVGPADSNHTHNFTTASTGGGQAHNNLQPYITCYMWKRIAP